jgi:hypothetical protein
MADLPDSLMKLRAIARQKHFISCMSENRAFAIERTENSEIEAFLSSVLYVLCGKISTIQSIRARHIWRRPIFGL